MGAEPIASVGAGALRGVAGSFAPVPGPEPLRWPGQPVAESRRVALL